MIITKTFTIKITEDELKDIRIGSSYGYMDKSQKEHILELAQKAVNNTIEVTEYELSNLQHFYGNAYR